MKLRTVHKSLAASLGIVLGVASFVVPPHAEGAHADRQGARAGQSHTRSSSGSHTADGRTRHDVVTGSGGRTWQRDATATRDRDARTARRDVTITRPNGKTRTVEDSVQKTDDGHSRTTVRTDAQGRTATREADVSRDAQAGTRERDVTYTGVNGAVRTVQDDTTRTDSGYERSTVVTNPNGSTVTRDVDFERDPEAHTWTKDVVVEKSKAP